MSNHGFLAPIAEIFAYFLYEQISPYRLWEKLFGKKWNKKRVNTAIRIEKYVCICLSIELVCLIPINYYKPLDFPFIILTIFLLLIILWRLSNIVGAWLHVMVVGTGRLLYPPRTLLLILVNYLEVVLIFGFISFVFKNGFFNITRFPDYCSFNSVIDSLRYSIGIMTTIGSIYEPFSYGYAIFFFEIFVGLTFIAVIIQRAISRFPK